MKDTQFDLFSAPVPGESLTKAPGSTPYEQPPQFTDIEEASEYMFDVFVEPRESARIITLIKKGVTCEAVARTYLFAGFMAGKFTPDVVLLISRPVLYMIVAIAERAKGNGLLKKYTILNPDYDQKDFFSSIKDIQDVDVSEKEIDKVEDKLEEEPLDLKSPSDSPTGFSMVPPTSVKKGK